MHVDITHIRILSTATSTFSCLVNLLNNSLKNEYSRWRVIATYYNDYSTFGCL